MKGKNDELEAGLHQGDYLAPMNNERVYTKLQPRRTRNTISGNNPSRNSRHKRWMTRRHPFIDQITEVDLPSSWKSLNLECYDRNTNPDEHVVAFLAQANLYTSDDTILCCVFPMTLKETALTWYDRLLSLFIDNFNTLVSRFNTQYVRSRPHSMTSITLANLCQANDEPQSSTNPRPTLNELRILDI